MATLKQKIMKLISDEWGLIYNHEDCLCSLFDKTYLANDQNKYPFEHGFLTFAR